MRWLYLAIVVVGCGGDDNSGTDCTRTICEPDGGASGDSGSGDSDDGGGPDSGSGGSDDGGDAAKPDAGNGDTDAATDCMGEHPIIGPPRTCESGRCYCSDPDACFPPDRAERCCTVDVVCVP